MSTDFHGYAKPIPRGKRTFKDEEEKRASVRALRQKQKLIEIQSRRLDEYELQQALEEPPIDPFLNDFTFDEMQYEAPPGTEHYVEDEQSSNELWNILHRHLSECLRPGEHSQHWLDSKIHLMQTSHLNHQLDVLDLQSNMLHLGDRGIRRVSRWMIDYADILSGIKKIDVSNHKLTFIGLELVANMLPLSCVEVDASGNTGKDWVKGCMKIIQALRERGGGTFYCGRATAPELELLRTAVGSYFDEGGHVIVNIHRWGSATYVTELPSTIEVDANFYAAPDWTTHVPKPAGRRLNTPLSRTGLGQVGSVAGTSRASRSAASPMGLGGLGGLGSYGGGGGGGGGGSIGLGGLGSFR